MKRGQNLHFQGDKTRDVGRSTIGRSGDDCEIFYLFTERIWCGLMIVKQSSFHSKFTLIRVKKECLRLISCKI